MVVGFLVVFLWYCNKTATQVRSTITSWIQTSCPNEPVFILQPWIASVLISFASTLVLLRSATCCFWHIWLAGQQMDSSHFTDLASIVGWFSVAFIFFWGWGQLSCVNQVEFKWTPCYCLASDIMIKNLTRIFFVGFINEQIQLWSNVTKTFQNSLCISGIVCLYTDLGVLKE